MSKLITKKVINSPETCVDDNLRGVVALYPNLKLHPKHRVVTVRQNSDSKRVAVLGGGGSGHEPFAAGLIGSGMLDGAVAGGVFASPPTGNVLYAITQLYKYNSGGVLVLLGNYTGDRLNFGKAFEKARVAGIKVEGFILGEDVASSHNKTGGRSMCGEVFLYKLCGSMARRGYDLQTIHSMAGEVNKHMATLGICLTACSLPGQPPLFEIAADEMEIGAGVHGEAGVEKRKMGTAKEIVAIILDQVTAHLKLEAGARVAAMINNMGGTSLMEMNIIAAEIKDYLVQKKIRLERIFSGHLKTSLDMQGFQICLLHLNDTHGDLWLELIDLPTDALGWVGGAMSVGEGELEDGDDEDDEDGTLNDGKKKPSGPPLSARARELARSALRAACAELARREQLLNTLDSGCGDGDCGITLKNFAEAIKSYSETASFEYPSKFLWDLSEIAETDMGGTSGGVYSLGLAAAAQEFMNAETNNSETWLSAWNSAMAAITKYGGAEPGDRTMLDTLHAAATAFKEALSESNSMKIVLEKVIEAADKGAKATANMVARAGRASYVASVYTHDEDAGARAAAVWIEAILRTIIEHC
ncbi:triokinase/FMN cyclase-like [Zerene cesonia]|uniref:triokinase/FMN cyclase-like n=1 Tax=Zerene cesonia TaxID=33412 RepID=UPI0018E535BC|nr:triokinase/FMN cyclase-like [Zerene cesonia]